MDRLGCCSEGGRLFHNRDSAVRNLLSSNRDRVLGTRQVLMIDGLCWRRPEVAVSWRSSAKWFVDRRCYLIFNTRLYWEPTKLPENWRAVMWSYTDTHHATALCSTDRVTVVGAYKTVSDAAHYEQFCGYERLDQLLRSSSARSWRRICLVETPAPDCCF